jgi:hypothetical protein
MKKALISPDEQIYDFDGNQIGVRVAQVEDQNFDIAEPMFWVDCNDDVVADRWAYDMETKQIKQVPPMPDIVDTP